MSERSVIMGECKEMSRSLGKQICLALITRSDVSTSIHPSVLDMQTRYLRFSSVHSMRISLSISSFSEKKTLIPFAFRFLSLHTPLKYAMPATFMQSPLIELNNLHTKSSTTFASLPHFYFSRRPCNEGSSHKVSHTRHQSVRTLTVMSNHTLNTRITLN